MLPNYIISTQIVMLNVAGKSLVCDSDALMIFFPTLLFKVYSTSTIVSYPK